MKTVTIVTRPEDLRELREIAAGERVSVQSLVDEALIKKHRERFPESAKLMDRTIRRNRRLYELLAAVHVSSRQSGPEDSSPTHH